ncbi:Ovocleidin-116, partial [Nestor notabilis]
MQTALACLCLCLCLLSTAFSIPVKNCGFYFFLLHQILLKGCNAKHGFYVFKYVYSFSTRRNQTQMK